MEDQRFWCEGQTLLARTLGNREAQELLVAAHHLGQSVFCSCRSPGIPMVLRRYSGKIHLARWPDTGERHARDCPSFDPSSNPAAIREHPDGTIEVRATFQLSVPSHGTRSAGGPISGGVPVAPHAHHLDLSGVLHELWRRAAFDKWFPGMQSRRSWKVVRYHIAEAASSVRIGHQMLGDVLLPVLPYHRDAPEAVEEQRARLLHLIGEHGIAVLLAPLKLVEPAKFGFRFEFYHLPKLPFFSSSSHGVPERLHRSPEGHRLVAMTLVDARGKHFRVHDIGVIAVTEHWLPYDRDADAGAIGGLAATSTRFLVRHGHLRVGAEVAIQLGGAQDGRLIFPDPNAPSGFRFDHNSSASEIRA